MEIVMGLSVKNSVEAVELYQKAFDLELGYNMKNEDGTYFHSELSRDGEGFGVVESTDETVSNNIVTIGITLDSEEEVKKAFEILSKDGIVKEPIGALPWTPCAATVIDKFGVCWYITCPQHRPPEDYDSNAAWDASMYKNPNK